MAKAKHRSDIKDTLRRVIQESHQQCIGLEGGVLSTQRASLKAQYLGNPYSLDKQQAADGWSTYVDRTVMETVEWAKPGLFRIFASGDELVRYEPSSPQDEQAAEDATDYVNQIFARNSFDIVHHCLTDGLYQRVGWAKVWYDKRDEDTCDKYEGLTQDEAEAMIMEAGASAKVEIESRPRDEADPMPELVYDVEIEQTKTIRQVKIDPIPSENVIIAGDTRDCETTRFIAHWEDKMASELIAEGYSKALVADLPRINVDKVNDYPETRVQQNINDESAAGEGDVGDPSTDLIRVYEAYTWADVDGDGKAERVKITYVGEAADANILDWEEWDMPRPPIFAACSLPMPHSVVGLCLADLVTDLQVLKSELTRYYLDNLYLANQGELVANTGTNGEINFDQILARRPGGIYTTSGDATITPLTVVNTGAEALAGLQMADQARETRTGIGSNLMGVQADELQNTATGAAIQEEAINQRQEMIARIYAETFFKPMAKYVLHLLHKYQDEPQEMRLRGKFQSLSPRNWNPDWDVRAVVGLGTSSRSKQAQGIQMVMQVQQAIAEKLGPLSPVKLSHIVYSAHKMAEGLGFESPERFFGTIEEAKAAEQQLAQQPPPPNPDMMKIQLEQQKAQAKMQIEQAKLQSKVRLDQQKAQADLVQNQQEMAMNYGLKQQEMAAEAELDALKIAMTPRQPVAIKQQQIGGE